MLMFRLEAGPESHRRSPPPSGKRNVSGKSFRVRSLLIAALRAFLYHSKTNLMWGRIRTSGVTSLAQLSRRGSVVKHTFDAAGSFRSQNEDAGIPRQC